MSRGVLVAFEGPDGAGKTTQRKLLKKWLQGVGQEVVTTKWKSSALIKPLIRARMAVHALSPVEFSILHAADFCHRFDFAIEPSLRQNKIVLADRYVFTGLARDAARGVDREWTLQLYEPVRWPDLVFYLAVSAETCARRIVADRNLKFYEAGQDITEISDRHESFLHFLPKVIAEYEKLSQEFSFIRVDAEQPIYEQHLFIRETVEQRLKAIAATA
jgi:dTMP kinase